MSDPQESPTAGWYTDTTDPSLERYWDGAAWTENTRPAGTQARSNKRVGIAVSGVVAMLLVIVAAYALAQSGGDAKTVEEVADRTVRAAERLDVDSGIDLLCTLPSSDQIEILEDMIERAQEAAGSSRPDITYSVSAVRGEESGSFRLTVSSDEPALRDHPGVSTTVVVDHRDSRSCIAGIEQGGEIIRPGEGAADDATGGPEDDG